MSRMGTFVLDIQTAVCELHGRSLDVVEAEIRSMYEDSGYADYAVDVARNEFLTIHGDLEEYERSARETY